MLTRLRTFLRQWLGLAATDALVDGLRRDHDTLDGTVSTVHAAAADTLERTGQIAIAAFQGLSDVDDRLRTHESTIPRMRDTRRKIDQARVAAELARRRVNPDAARVGATGDSHVDGPMLVRDESVPA